MIGLKFRKVLKPRTFCRFTRYGNMALIIRHCLKVPENQGMPEELGIWNCAQEIEYEEEKQNN